jgi:anti-sigma regulatory factor (Ser/Thr protein kinase)
VAAPPMSTDHTALRHNALVYDAQDEYVERSVAFLREGLAAGEGAVVANTRPGIAAMREALGPDAEHVRFVDVSFAYTRPAHALAAYHAVYAEQLGRTRALRAVADVQCGPEPGEWDRWIGYEAVFNRSFGHLPAWVLCSYNTNGLPDAVLEGVWRTHPEVVSDWTWRRSGSFEEPADVLRRLTPAPGPLAGLRSIPAGPGVESFREALAAELAAAGVSEARSLDMLVAATEIARNAAVHGGGIEDVRVGAADGRFVCEVVDRGPGFDDPTAGYLAPRTGAGAGLWVARQLVWEIEFLRAAGRFTARIWL